MKTINSNKAAYLMGYFRSGPGQMHKSEKLHYAYSRDGLFWKELNNNKSTFTTCLGERVLRDPFIAKGPDGYWHMVFTIRPRGGSIGYARSKDLISWEDETMIEVMAGVDKVQNCWAPEFTYDPERSCYIIYWASSIGDNLSNSKHFCVRTYDWKAFTQAEIFFDPGFQTIDASLIQHNEKSYMAFKDESMVYNQSNDGNQPHNKLAVADKIDGSYKIIEHIQTPYFTEGPQFLEIRDEKFLLIYDYWAYGKFGVMESIDLESWRTLEENEYHFPFQARHGTVFQIDENDLTKLLYRYSLVARYPTKTFNKVRLAEENGEGFLHDSFNEKTISLWIKPFSRKGTQIIFQEGNDINGLTLRTNENTMELAVCSDGQRKSISSSIKENKEKYHICVVFNKGNLFLYLDGQCVATKDTGFKRIHYHFSPAGFGGRFDTDAFGDSSGPKLFQGEIQDLKIFNTSLFEEDIRLIK